MWSLWHDTWQVVSRSLITIYISLCFLNTEHTNLDNTHLLIVHYADPSLTTNAEYKKRMLTCDVPLGSPSCSVLASASRVSATRIVIVTISQSSQQAAQRRHVRPIPPSRISRSASCPRTSLCQGRSPITHDGKDKALALFLFDPNLSFRDAAGASKASFQDQD